VSPGATANTERAPAVRRVLLVTFILNAVVAAAKLGYGWRVDSLSIRADGFHSSMDALGNVVAWVGIAIAARPADEGHPYGHKKIEVLLAALVGVLLLGTAFSVARDAVARLLKDAATPPPDLDAGAFAVLAATLVVNVAVSIWEARAGRRWASPLLVTDALHTRSDVAITLGVLAATALTALGHPDVDVAAGLAVAAFVAVTGARLLRNNAAFLIDAACVPPSEIQATARSVPGVLSISHVRTRGAPGSVAMDLRAQVDPTLTIEAAHAIGHALSDALTTAHQTIVDVVVHVEPAARPPTNSP
jgi:cation diffusion facilitator family transporter